MALGEHLRAHEDVDLLVAHLPQHLREARPCARWSRGRRARCARRAAPRASVSSMRCVPWPTGARSALPHPGQRAGTRSRCPQWWQRSSPAFMCRTRFALQRPQVECHAQERQKSTGEKPRRLRKTRLCSPLREARLERAQQRVGHARRRGLSARVSTMRTRRQRRRPRGARSLSSHERVAALLRVGPGLERRRGRAQHHGDRRHLRAAHGDVARRVAKALVLLVGGVVLLVDDDEPELRHRRRARRAACPARCAPGPTAPRATPPRARPRRGGCARPRWTRRGSGRARAPRAAA